MARAYSDDLRTRVISDVEAGMSPEQAAEKYAVTARTIYQWKTLKRETGSLAPRRGRPGRKRTLEGYREAICGALQQNPGLTLKDLHAQLNLPGCLQTLWHALRRWGMTLKKSSPGHRTRAA